jgi:hypothetical protein
LETIMTTETKTLQEYPQFPLLSLAQCATIFTAANIGPQFIADWTGYSRVGVSRWLAEGGGDNIKKASHEHVSALAYKVLRALKHKHYPLVRTRNPSASAFAVLRDPAYEKPLSAYTPEELLPKAWLEQFNLPREHHAPEPVL